MSSATISFSGNTSILTSSFYPELELEKGYSYSCALLEFTAYNSIPNVTKENNKIYFKTRTKAVNVKDASVFDAKQNIYYFAIPPGAYEFNHITEYIKDRFESIGFKCILSVNPHTYKGNVDCDVEIHFNQPDSIHHLFGFDDYIIESDEERFSDRLVEITSVNTIVVECDIISGSYTNGKQGHSIHEFAVTANPGYKIIEVPKHIIYLPINRSAIPSIQIRITDQDGKLIDFRGETITCRIHIKRE